MQLRIPIQRPAHQINRSFAYSISHVRAWSFIMLDNFMDEFSFYCNINQEQIKFEKRGNQNAVNKGCFSSELFLNKYHTQINCQSKQKEQQLNLLPKVSFTRISTFGDLLLFIFFYSELNKCYFHKKKKKRIKKAIYLECLKHVYILIYLCKCSLGTEMLKMTASFWYKTECWEREK